MAEETHTLTKSDGGLNRLLWILSAALFLIFFQGFMVAPLIPRLAQVFGVTPETISFIFPAYLLAYGSTTIVYGPLADRLGRRRVLFVSLLAFVLLTSLTSLARSAPQLIGIRLLTGLGASGVAPLSLGFVGDLFPYRQRGRALGWLFGAIAGGMAFGSTAGALLEPHIGWRGLFLGVAISGVCVVAALVPCGEILDTRTPGSAPLTFHSLGPSLHGLLGARRGQRAYAYVFFNGLFHSGVYTWLGFFFVQRYHLGETGIGLALLGYGVPGLLLGPGIGRIADRWGRSRLIPAGIAIAGISCAALTLPVPLTAAALLVTFLSLGYDMSQPLLAAIVTDLSLNRGLAMGLFAFSQFMGFGLGSLAFSGALRFGLNAALISFGLTALLGALLAIPLFHAEGLPPQREVPPTPGAEGETLSP